MLRETENSWGSPAKIWGSGWPTGGFLAAATESRTDHLPELSGTQDLLWLWARWGWSTWISPPWSTCPGICSVRTAPPAPAAAGRWSESSVFSASSSCRPCPGCRCDCPRPHCSDWEPPRGLKETTEMRLSPCQTRPHVCPHVPLCRTGVISQQEQCLSQWILIWAGVT